MKDILISLTDEQERFLKLFAKNHYSGSNDNLGTNNPIHVVQTIRERVVDKDYDTPDKTIYYLDGDYEGGYDTVKEVVEAYYKYNHCNIEIISFDEAYDADVFIGVDGDEYVIVDENDYLEAYGISEDMVNKVHVEFYYEDVAFFFILEEAKRYMEYQRHNLTTPRTYTYGAGYANKGEYHHFWELLYRIGEKLNKELEG